MNILTVGGSGFIGSYVLKQLLEDGHKIINIDPQKVSLEIRNYSMYEWIDLAIQDVFAEIQTLLPSIDLIINFAALVGGVEYFHKYPATILAENSSILISTFKLAEKLCRPYVIQFSSSMVFERATKFPIVESDLEQVPLPITAYGMSKLLAEYFCKAYYEEHGVNYTIVRPFNVIGIGEDPRKDSHVLPQLVYKIMSGQDPLQILGDGRQVRCYTHGKDLAKGISLLINHLENGDPRVMHTDFNFSSDRSTSVLDLIDLIWKEVKPFRQLRIQHLPAPKYDVEMRTSDCTKAKTILGWRSQISLEEAICDLSTATFNYII